MKFAQLLVREADTMVVVVVGALSVEPVARALHAACRSHRLLSTQMTAATRLDRADRHRLINHSANRRDSLGSRAGALLPILRDGTLLIWLSTSMRQINPFSSVS